MGEANWPKTCQICTAGRVAVLFDWTGALFGRNEKGMYKHHAKIDITPSLHPRHYKCVQSISPFGKTFLALEIVVQMFNCE
jgi:hypothetical protein